MLQYSARTLLCAVDGVPIRSVAVVYKEQSFIGDVFGELCLMLTLTHAILPESMPFELVGLLE